MATRPAFGAERLDLHDRPSSIYDLGRVRTIYLSLAFTVVTAVQGFDECQQTFCKDDQVTRVRCKRVKRVSNARGHEYCRTLWDVHLPVGESEAQDPGEDVPRLIVLVMYVEL
jgi:hypothetical protein